jgi:parvulin-like peptidyl-prolyl isomerase
LLLTGAVVAGLLTSEGLYRSAAGKDAVERLCRWSRDFAASYGIGLHGNDQDAEEILIAKNLRSVSHDEVAADKDIDRELNLLRAQFGDETIFKRAMKSSELTEALLREELAEHLRGLAWTEKQLSGARVVSDSEARTFYESKREQFQQPQRFRASHLFLAAPDGSQPEVIAAKQSMIQGIAIRILGGETFPQLVLEATEDEATKSRGGDLDYFAAARMPPEFLAEVEKLHVGELSAPIRSHLGFHIVQLTEVKPPRDLSFEEARPEILVSLGNGKRAAAVAQLRERLLTR